MAASFVVNLVAANFGYCRDTCPDIVSHHRAFVGVDSATAAVCALCRYHDMLFPVRNLRIGRAAASPHLTPMHGRAAPSRYALVQQHSDSLNEIEYH